MTPPMMQRIITPQGVQNGMIALVGNGIQRMPGGVMTPPYNPVLQKLRNPFHLY